MDWAAPPPDPLSGGGTRGSDAWPEVDAPSAPLPNLADPIPFPGPPIPTNSDEGLSWADELFQDAPIPGARPEGDIFDEPDSSEPEPDGDSIDDGLEADPEASGEEAGWFDQAQTGDSAELDAADDDPAPEKSNAGLLVFGAMVIAVVGIIAWLSSGNGFMLGGAGGTSGSAGGATAVEDGAGSGGPVPDGGGASDGSAKSAKAEAPTDPAAKPPEETPKGDEASEKPSPATPEASKPDGSAAPPAEDAAAKPPEPTTPRTPAKKTATTVTERGWRSVDRKRWADAEKYFVDALKLRPNHAPASYGLGYISQQRGDTNAAKTYYCKALSDAGRDVDLKREVEAGLRKLGATCPWGP